jgi:RNA polymerase-binding transcription factor DksA
VRLDFFSESASIRVNPRQSLHARTALLKLFDQVNVMEVTIMSGNSGIRVTDNTPERNGGLVWNRLHSEREDICEALLKECAPDYEGLRVLRACAQNFAQAETPGVLNDDAIQTANWHRELLQARLRRIDDALDRLMAGSYGNCCKCGRWIEDTKLDFDPAVAFCVDCWERMQTIH